MESSTISQDRRDSAIAFLQEVYRNNMACLPIEIQEIIESIPAQEAKDHVKHEISTAMEVADPLSRKHITTLLAGMFIYAHLSGHFDDRALTILTRFRADLGARRYVSRGPFLHRPQS